ncbi:hypothetical protein E7T09_00520 [Deinococcus sp. KSM4-11]|nr:hypothetical protein E7T09_00520 [Deinococcus sp. KSM4-11]
MPGDLLVDTLWRDPTSAERLGLRLGELHAWLHAWHVPDAICQVLRLPDDAPVQGKALLHLDLHLLNVLVHGGQLGTVLDWEGARLGDARLDVARTLSILSVDPAILALSPEHRQAVRRLRRAYLEAYSRATEVTSDGLAPFLAWAGRYLIKDLSGKVEDGTLDPARRWTRAWLRRAAGQRPS